MDWRGSVSRPQQHNAEQKVKIYHQTTPRTVRRWFCEAESTTYSGHNYIKKQQTMTWLQLMHKTAIVTGAGSGIGAAGMYCCGRKNVRPFLH